MTLVTDTATWPSEPRSSNLRTNEFASTPRGVVSRGKQCLKRTRNVENFPSTRDVARRLEGEREMNANDQMTARWGEVAEALAKRGAAALVEMLSPALCAAIDATASEHPLEELLRQPASGGLSLTVAQTNIAIEHISHWLQRSDGAVHDSWWKTKVAGLTTDDAASVLAEFRALGTMLSTLDGPGALDVAPVSVMKTKTPDFAIAGGEAFVEVCCVRMNEDERKRQRQLDEVERDLTTRSRDAAVELLKECSTSAVTARATATWIDQSPSGPKTSRHHVDSTAVRRPDGEASTFSIASRAVRSFGPQKGGSDPHTVASRLASRKPPGQVPKDRPGILWMDLCDPSYALSVDSLRPAELFWKGMTLVTTHGPWHSFYGRKDVTWMMERSPLGIAAAGRSHSFRQKFSGRLRRPEGRCWSAVVLRCTDGIAVFENPDATTPVPFGLLRQLVALQGYAASASFHRVSDHDFDGLRQQLEATERRLAFYAGYDRACPSPDREL